MVPPRPGPRRPRALLIESQRIVAPYLVEVIEAAGTRVVAVSSTGSTATLREIDPDLVVIDAGGVGNPLRLVRRIRGDVPNARLVVYSRAAGPLWESLARSLGADVIIGAYGDENELRAAVAA